MKIGDLVIRKHDKYDGHRQRSENGVGIIISKQMGGMNPSHPCITVLYPKIGKQYDIAESLMEVVSEV